MRPTRVVVLLRRLQAAPDGARAASLLGPCDEAAFRAALALRGRGAVQLAVVAAGPPELEDEVLTHALACGADRALRVSHESLAGIDYHGIARVLSSAARHVGFDLVLLGAQSADEGSGAVGPAVAEALGVAHVTAAVDVSLADGAALVARRDHAHIRTLRLPLPAVVTITRSPEEAPRVVARAGAAIETLELRALGIQPPELHPRESCLGRAVVAPGPRCAMLLARADELVALLRDERLIDP